MQHWKHECAYILNFLSVNAFILMHILNFILFQQGQCLQWHDIKNSDKQRVNGKWRQEKMRKSPRTRHMIHIQTIGHRASLVAWMVKNSSAMQETQVQSLGWKDHLERGMATHSSMLTWRIPWTEEPGVVQSRESQRVGHDWVTNTICHRISNVSGKLVSLGLSFLACNIKRQMW